MASLFISYSRKDIEAARKLTEAFKGQDLDFWIDWEGIPPTVDWWKEIEKGIEEADIFLFLLSPDSCKSSVCQREIEHAIKSGKRLIPIVVRDVKAEESPAELRHLNWIFSRESDDFNTAFTKLITAIQTDYVWVQAHRQLLVKALEWERSDYKNAFLLRGEELQDAESQLASNASKQPHATDLQREYVLKSRQESERQRQVTRRIAVGVIVALAALALFGFWQASLATANARKEQEASTLAVSNASTAQSASTLAFDNAATAQANAEEEQRQSRIALARQLAAQAQAINATRNSKQMIGALLAVQSMRLFPTSEGAQVLLNEDFSAQTIAEMTHDELVYSVAFSPDGRYVVSGSNDFTARVWEAATGKEVARMTHDFDVSSVAFSPDGRYVVSGSFDTTARVWEAATGNEVARMLHDEWVATVAFSPDGHYVVSGGGDGTARVWEATTGKEITRMIFEGDVLSVSFSLDGRHVASAVSAEDSSAVLVWEALSGREISHMRHDGTVWAVAFSPDGNYVASQIGDDTASIWEVSSGKEITRFTHRTSPSRGGGGATQRGRQTIAFSPDGKYVVSGGDISACVWDASTGKEISCMIHDFGVRSVAFSPDGRYVVSGSGDGTARVWEVSSGREVSRMTHEGTVYSTVFSPDGRYVVSGSGGGTARVWEAITENEIARRIADRDTWAVSPDQKYMVVRGDNDSQLEILEVGSSEPLAQMNYEGDLRWVDYSPNGRYLALTTEDTIQIWKSFTGEEVTQITLNGNVDFTYFSPDSQYVVLTYRDGLTEIWEAASGREITRALHDGDVYSVSFSPDGKSVVTGSQDGIATVWELSSRQEVARVTHEAGVRAVAFSPDGKYVVSTVCQSSEETERGVLCLESHVRVWEALTGREVTQMIQEMMVTGVSFSPDGKYLISASCEEPEIPTFCFPYSVRVSDAFTGREILWIGHMVSFLTFSPSGEYIMLPPVSVSSEPNTVRIWKASTGNEIAQIVHDNVVDAVEFSPDETYVVTGSWDRTARVWEVSGGREVARVTHDDSVTAVAFSPDGRFVVSAGDNETIRVWEATSGMEFARITVDHLVSGLAFSPDGELIVWEPGFGGLRQSQLWQPADLIADACARMPRNLTRAEWGQYVRDALPYQEICPNLPIEAEATPTSVPPP